MYYECSHLSRYATIGGFMNESRAVQPYLRIRAHYGLLTDNENTCCLTLCYLQCASASRGTKTDAFDIKARRYYQLGENVKLFIVRKCGRMESSQTQDGDLTCHCPPGYLTGQRLQALKGRWYLFH